MAGEARPPVEIGMKITLGLHPKRMPANQVRIGSRPSRSHMAPHAPVPDPRMRRGDGLPSRRSQSPTALEDPPLGAPGEGIRLVGDQLIMASTTGVPSFTGPELRHRTSSPTLLVAGRAGQARSVGIGCCRFGTNQDLVMIALSGVAPGTTGSVHSIPLFGSVHGSGVGGVFPLFPYCDLGFKSRGEFGVSTEEGRQQQEKERQAHDPGQDDLRVFGPVRLQPQKTAALRAVTHDPSSGASATAV
jgi:hypothetical protein